MKHKSLAVLLIVGMAVAMCGCQSMSGASPEATITGPSTVNKLSYQCHHVSTRAIKIDGKLDEKAWKKAQVLTGFMTSGPTPVPASWETEAQLLWSDTDLIVAFRCKNDAIRPAGRNRDDPVYDGDATELFLSPLGGNNPYFEIDCGPTNLIFDGRFLSWRHDDLVRNTTEWAKAFNPPIRSAVSVETDADSKVTGWTIEYALPFSAMTNDAVSQPKVGSSWLFNVCRAAKLSKYQPVEYSTWSPTFSDFHHPYKLPRLVFAGSK